MQTRPGTLGLPGAETPQPGLLADVPRVFVGQPAACCRTCKPREVQRKQNERCCTWIYCSPPSCQADTYFFSVQEWKGNGLLSVPCLLVQGVYDLWKQVQASVLSTFMWEGQGGDKHL